MSSITLTTSTFFEQVHFKSSPSFYDFPIGYLMSRVSWSWKRNQPLCPKPPARQVFTLHPLSIISLLLITFQHLAKGDYLYTPSIPQWNFLLPTAFIVSLPSHPSFYMLKFVHLLFSFSSFSFSTTSLLDLIYLLHFFFMWPSIRFYFL